MHQARYYEACLSSTEHGDRLYQNLCVVKQPRPRNYLARYGALTNRAMRRVCPERRLCFGEQTTCPTVDYTMTWWGLANLDTKYALPAEPPSGVQQGEACTCAITVARRIERLGTLCSLRAGVTACFHVHVRHHPLILVVEVMAMENHRCQIWDTRCNAHHGVCSPM